MAIETFYTAQSQNTASSAARGAGGRDASPSASGAAKSALEGGFGFFDMFLQTAATALENAGQQQAGQGKSILDLPLDQLDENSPLSNLIDAMSASEGVQEQLAKLDSPTVADVINLSKLSPEQGIAADGSDVSGTDADAAPDILKGAFLIEDSKNGRPALNDLARIVKRLEALIEEDSGSLIAANLTPEQMTGLKSKLDALMNGIQEEQATDATEDNAENYAGFVLGLIRLLPPQGKNDLIASGKAVVLGDAALNTDAKTIGTKDLAAQLNGIVVGEEDGETSWNYSDMGDFESFLDSLKGEKSGKGATLGEMLGGKAGNDNTSNNAINGAGVNINGVLKNWPFGHSGSLFSPIEYSQDAAAAMGLGHSQTPVTGAAAMTSVLTQSHAATLPHPGTQMVAVNLKKLASNGETRDIRLQLDPPELGRVEIRMSFAKDAKGVKALLSAEKPETFMMLQRDAHLLERALQEAGLEADASSLSFELAQDGQNFNQDGSHDGSRNQARSQNGAGEEETIETTMTWQVDPQTGHMRYNILA